MRRGRFVLTMAMLAICLFVATNPVFAAAGSNTNNGNGKGNGGPGNPVLPEAPVAVLLPIIGLIVVGFVLLVVYRRQHRRDMTAE